MSAQKPAVAFAWDLLAAVAPDSDESRALAETRRIATSQKAWRRDMFRMALSSSVKRIPSARVFAALRPDLLSSQEMEAAFESVHKKLNNIPDRAKLLDAWMALGLVPRKSADLLTEAVYMPIAEAGKGGLQAAIKRVALIEQASPDKQRAVRERLLRVGRTHKLGKQVDKGLESVGLLKKKSLLRGGGYRKADPGDEESS